MSDETQPEDSALPEIRGRWWPCICGDGRHAQFLPSDQTPVGRHGTFIDVDDKGRRTVVTHWRAQTPRCFRSLAAAPTAPMTKPARKPVERAAERPVEAVHQEAGAA